MSTDKELAVAVQRQVLREQMRAQRAVIEHQLDPKMGAGDRHYPRSATMRFLTRRPGLASSLLGEAAALLVGARALKSVGKAVAIVRILRIVRATGRNRRH